MCNANVHFHFCFLSLAGFSYVGCFKDEYNDRALEVELAPHQTSPEACAILVKKAIAEQGKAYKFFGIQVSKYLRPT